MHPRVLIGLTVFFVISFVTSTVVHWFIVSRDLYRQGDKFPTGLFPWRIFREMAMYEDLCRARGDSLSWFYIIYVGLWFTFVLGVAAGFMWLTRSQQPLR